MQDAPRAGVGGSGQARKGRRRQTWLWEEGEDRGPETTWIGGADGEGTEEGDGAELEKLQPSWPGSHSLGLGAATPPPQPPSVGTCWHGPAKALWLQHPRTRTNAETFLNRRTHSHGHTNPHIPRDTRRQRHAGTGIESKRHTSTCMCVCRHAQTQKHKH